MKSYVINILVAILFFFFTACPSEDQIEPCTELTRAVFKDFTGLDGCTWILELDNGDKLEPTNLGQFVIEPEEGKVVGINYTQFDGASICMVGEIVELQCLDLWD